MNQQLQLLEKYREAIAQALLVAPIEEHSLYTSHEQELERLGALLSSASSASAAALVIAGERRAFGWSFLPGAHGARVESAFHVLASHIEQQAGQQENGV